MNSNLKVAVLIDNNRWNLNTINHIIDDRTRDDILGINIPLDPDISDYPCWVGTSSGMFSTASAYDLINKHDNDLEGWSWLWKLHLPAKFKTFLWLIMLDKLPTNSLRAHRGMTECAQRPRCNKL